MNVELQKEQTNELNRKQEEDAMNEVEEGIQGNKSSIKKCQHIKSVKSRKFLDQIKHLKSLVCATCNKLEGNLNDLWICCICTKCYCSKQLNGHDNEHAQEYKHSLMINVGTGDCWCFECNGALPIADRRMRVVSEWSASTLKRVRKMTDKSVSSEIVKGGNPKRAFHQRNAPYKKQQLGVHGLRNLGNTCFFNSSMQALSVSNPLQQALEARPPTSLKDGSSPLMIAFIKLQNKMRDGSSDLIVPSELHSAICRRWRQFKGFRQHDAHELLRCLLDGLREDELKSIRHSKEDDKEKEREDKEKLKEDPVTFVDQSFGGKLASIVMCETCKTCSYAYENVLDVAVPISDNLKKLKSEKEVPVLDKKSKHQCKMESKRKIVKPNRRNKKESKRKTLKEEEEEDEPEPEPEIVVKEPVVEGPVVEEKKDSEIKIEVVDDDELVPIQKQMENINLEDAVCEKEKEEEKEENEKKAGFEVVVDDKVSELQQHMKNVTLEGTTEKVETIEQIDNADLDYDMNVGQGMEDHQQLEEEKPVEENQSNNSNSLIPPPSLEQQRLITRLFSNQMHNNSAASSVSITTCLADFTQTELLREDNQFACETCWRLLNPDAQAEEEEEEEKKDEDDQLQENEEEGNMDKEKYIESEKDENTSESTLSTESVKNNSSTLDENLSEDEKTVDSANESDQSDILTDALGNYIPAKPKITAAQSSANTAKKAAPRYVLRDARKRLLICHPAPRMLMIQLKRFEQTIRGRTRKIERHVDLDAELDLTPFMVAPAPSPPNNNNETQAVAEHKTETAAIRYRLVAVIEQSGGLVGGHYVAYVLTKCARQAACDDNDTKALDSADDRSWVYCSDGQTRPSSWEEVVRSQAYIAFYESIA
ncbi:hypothetical protein BDF19DRAFT_435508 [Syncephalis fuscata]|nr:hypothetical protein BDF19DRAFT_435508 [Syncephalis fuscata]